MTLTKSAGTALITGASGGIGATYADRLAQRGFNLILVARDNARLAKVAADIRGKYQVDIEALRADLTHREDLLRVGQLLRSDRRITMLINNAGIASANSLANSSSAEIDAMVDLNVGAVTHLASAAAQNFCEQGEGTLINISSVLALAPERSNAIYGATKSYVLNLTMTLCQEVAAQGVRVQAVLPGVTRTEIWERAGLALEKLPASLVMEVGEMVDAALAGLDQGELITIPALDDMAAFRTYDAARVALGPNLSGNHAARRYRKS